MLIEILKRVLPFIAKKALSRGLKLEDLADRIQDLLDDDDEIKKLLAEQEKSFREWTVKYEGAYAELPKGLRVARAALRPIVTYLTWAVTLALFAFGKPIPSQLWTLNVIVLIFWFGEPTVSRAIETVKTGRYLGR